MAGLLPDDKRMVAETPLRQTLDGPGWRRGLRSENWDVGCGLLAGERLEQTRKRALNGAT